MNRALILGLVLLLSGCKNNADTSGIILQDASSQVYPNDTSLKPNLAGINWQRDKGQQVREKMAKANYALMARDDGGLMQIWAGRTLGQNSMVRYDFNADGLIGRVVVTFTDPQQGRWQQYAALRQQIIKQYGPGAVVGEPKQALSDAQLRRLYQQGKAPATYWNFKKSGYMLALLIDAPFRQSGDDTPFVSMSIEPPDWNPESFNTRLEEWIQKKKAGTPTTPPPGLPNQKP